MWSFLVFWLACLDLALARANRSVLGKLLASAHRFYGRAIGCHNRGSFLFSLLIGQTFTDKPPFFTSTSTSHGRLASIIIHMTSPSILTFSFAPAAINLRHGLDPSLASFPITCHLPPIFHPAFSFDRFIPYLSISEHGPKTSGLHMGIAQGTLGALKLVMQNSPASQVRVRCWVLFFSLQIFHYWIWFLCKSVLGTSAACHALKDQFARCTARRTGSIFSIPPFFIFVFVPITNPRFAARLQFNATTVRRWRPHCGGRTMKETPYATR